MNNKYLEKIAELSDQTKNDLSTTGKVMVSGTAAGGIGMGINHMLGLSSPHFSQATSLMKRPSLMGRVKMNLASAAKPKNLAAMGVLGAVGGLGDYLAISHGHSQNNSKEL